MKHFMKLIYTNLQKIEGRKYITIHNIAHNFEDYSNMLTYEYQIMAVYILKEAQ